MKKVYPVVFTKLSDGYAAYVPDFEIDTQGNDLAQAISMARDAIGLMGIDMQDDKKTLPEPSPVELVKVNSGEVVSLVDIDFIAYRRAHERRTIRRSVTIPSWLNDEAARAGINVSALTVAALKQELHISE